MLRSALLISLLSLPCCVLPCQAQSAPYAPFTAKQAELGKQLVAKSVEIRKQITDMSAPAEPFKIMGNLYFVGVANGEAYLLTSPQGHILMGAAMEMPPQRVQKNIESLGFKMTDIKAILLNHNHEDQSGGAAYMKEKTGAPVMAGFAEIPYLEHGMFNPPAIPARAGCANGGRAGAGPPPLSSGQSGPRALRWRCGQSRAVECDHLLDSGTQPSIHNLRLYGERRRQATTK